MKAPDSTVPRCIGRSYDERTQRWQVTCPICLHVWEPSTTRLAFQYLECPKRKCLAALSVDYNNLIVTVRP